MLKLISRALMLAVFGVGLAAPVSAASHPENAIYLFNSGSISIPFRYGCKGSGTPWSHRLASRHGSWFWAKNGCRFYTVKIKTANGGTYTYNDATAGHRYEFYYNRGDRQWIIDSY